MHQTPDPVLSSTCQHIDDSRLLAADCLQLVACLSRVFLRRPSTGESLLQRVQEMKGCSAFEPSVETVAVGFKAHWFIAPSCPHKQRSRLRARLA
jgi:hypothetical protein